MEEGAAIAIPAHHMGSKDHRQAVVSVLVMVEAGDIGICFGKPVCPDGREGGRIG
jgi:hypothetical protein